MTTNTGRVLALALLFCALQTPIHAATAVANEPGFSGFFNLGVTAGSGKSNLIAEIGDDEIDNIEDSPGSKSSTSITPGLSLTYTFDNLNSEVYLGNSLEDFVRFDFSTVLGFRQQVSEVGIFDVALLASPVATEIWKDPYAAGVERDETDRSADGIRIEWGAIMGSGFDFRLSSRDSEIDDEESGAALLAADVITASEQGLLDRNGDINSTSLIYNWDQGQGQLLSLLVTYLEHDLDGEAMSFDGYSVQLNNVTAFSPDLRLATNIVLGRFDHDTENPVYGKTNDKDLTALTLTLFLNDPFGAKNWVGNLTMAYAEEDNSIDFYDTTVSMINLGMIRRF
jgi:hypothetical protein